MSASQADLLAEAVEYVRALCPRASQPSIDAALAGFSQTNELQGKAFALALQTYIQREVLPKLDCAGAVGANDAKPPAATRPVPAPTEPGPPVDQRIHTENVHHVYEAGRGGGDTGATEAVLRALQRLAAQPQRTGNVGRVAGNGRKPMKPAGHGAHKNTIAYGNSGRAIEDAGDLVGLYQQIDDQYKATDQNPLRQIERLRQLRALAFFAAGLNGNPEVAEVQAHFAAALAEAERQASPDTLLQAKFDELMGARKQVDRKTLRGQEAAFLKLIPWAERNRGRLDDLQQSQIKAWQGEIEQVHRADVLTKLEAAGKGPRAQARALQQVRELYGGTPHWGYMKPVIDGWEEDQLDKKVQTYFSILQDIAALDETKQQKQQRVQKVRTDMLRDGIPAAHPSLQGLLQTAADVVPVEETPREKWQRLWTDMATLGDNVFVNANAKLAFWKHAMEKEDAEGRVFAEAFLRDKKQEMLEDIETKMAEDLGRPITTPAEEYTLRKNLQEYEKFHVTWGEPETDITRRLVEQAREALEAAQAKWRPNVATNIPPTTTTATGTDAPAINTATNTTAPINATGIPTTTAATGADAPAVTNTATNTTAPINTTGIPTTTAATGADAPAVTNTATNTTAPTNTAAPTPVTTVRNPVATDATRPVTTGGLRAALDLTQNTNWGELAAILRGPNPAATGANGPGTANATAPVNTTDTSTPPTGIVGDAGISTGPQDTIMRDVAATLPTGSTPVTTATGRVGDAGISTGPPSTILRDLAAVLRGPNPAATGANGPGTAIATAPVNTTDTSTPPTGIVGDAGISTGPQDTIMRDVAATLPTGSTPVTTATGRVGDAGISTGPPSTILRDLAAVLSGGRRPVRRRPTRNPSPLQVASAVPLPSDILQAASAVPLPAGNAETGHENSYTEDDIAQLLQGLIEVATQQAAPDRDTANGLPAEQADGQATDDTVVDPEVVQSVAAALGVNQATDDTVVDPAVVQSVAEARPAVPEGRDEDTYSANETNDAAGKLCMVVSTDCREAVKVGGCCCSKATCKCASLVTPAASMRG